MTYTNNMQERFEILINDIKIFTASFEADESLNEVRTKYYKGVQVLFSPLIFNPTFLFIGINPGSGYFKFNNQNVKRFKGLQHFEYLHYNYQLARETRKVFEKAGLVQELNRSVKTNCYFFATATQKDLHGFLSQLNGKYDVYKHSARWLKELIGIVSPQLIICEGKSAFEKLVKIGYSVTGNGHLCGTYKDIPVIGYRRYRSFIKEKQSLSKLIRIKYDEINVKALDQGLTTFSSQS